MISTFSSLFPLGGWIHERSLNVCVCVNDRLEISSLYNLRSFFSSSTYSSLFLFFTVNFFVKIYSKTRCVEEEKERQRRFDAVVGQQSIAGETALNVKRAIPIEIESLQIFFESVTSLGVKINFSSL